MCYRKATHTQNPHQNDRHGHRGTPPRPYTPPQKAPSQPRCLGAHEYPDSLFLCRTAHTNHIMHARTTTTPNCAGGVGPGASLACAGVCTLWCSSEDKPRPRYHSQVRHAWRSWGWVRLRWPAPKTRARMTGTAIANHPRDPHKALRTTTPSTRLNSRQMPQNAPLTFRAPRNNLIIHARHLRQP
jgi:hypothetical protein